MIKLHTQLMYPEPEDTGSGSAATNYSIDSVKDEPPAEGGTPPEGETKPAETPSEGAEAPAPEYTLTFEESDNINEQYRAVLTAAARETEGLDAAIASKLFHTLTGKLSEENSRAFLADDAALKAEWGRDFDSRVNQTLTFMKRHFVQAGCTPEEIAMFENPRGLRVANKLMQLYTEGKAVGTDTAASTDSSMSTEEFIRQKSHQLIVERNKSEPNQALLKQLRREINERVGLKV